MGPSMAKHRDAFAREGVDGELLAQCTEEILEKELGVTSHLDRINSCRYVAHYDTVTPKVLRLRCTNCSL